MRSLLYYQKLNGAYPAAVCAHCGISFKESYFQEKYLPHVCLYAAYDWACGPRTKDHSAAVMTRIQACGAI